jgi:hypothetical protein
MSDQIQQEISNLLAQIDAYNQADTEPGDESQPRRRLNVYIDLQEQEIPPTEEENRPTIESMLDERDTPTPRDESETPSRDEQQQSDPLPVQSSKHPRTRPVVLVLLLVACIGLLIGPGYGVIVPLFTPSATITIVTAAVQQSTTTTIHVVNGAADPTKREIRERELAAITMSQQKTVATTGTARQQARQAHGSVTFYNAATYPQTIPAGTMLAGADGVQLVTDQDATIPAAIFPTFGQRRVAAHAATTGPGGNVRAGDVYGACCRVNVSAVNGAFTGGQDARTYQTVTQQDINEVVTSVKTSLEQSVQAALQTQVQQSETLITPLDCTQKVTPDHQPGEEATQVSVAIDETCTGTVYTTQAFTALTAQNATQDAERRLGAGYTTTSIQTTITQASPKGHGSIDLQTKSVSMWAYQYGPEQEQSIRAMIAGMSKEKAKTTLLHLTAVQSVSITITNSATMPTETEHIHLIFMQM